MKTDYSVYRLSIREWILCLLQAILLTAGINYLFYRNIFAFIFLLPLPVLWIRELKKQMKKTRLRKLNYEFRSALNSLSVSLRAGYSVENAFRETEKDLKGVLGVKAEMTKEIAWINSQLRVSVPIEKLLGDFAARTGIEDIENFAGVFSAAKRMGGNMVEIVQSTARTISGKIDVEREIETALAAKKYEQKVMALMPCGIILYMQIASPGFLDSLYGNALGVIVMTACLLLYAAAFLLGKKIVEIEV